MNTLKFELSEKEQKALNYFILRHKKCGIFPSTTGGKYSYTFTPTGLGTCIVVKCNVCGKTKDITDIDFW